jgi:hypothetical protein
VLLQLSAEGKSFKNNKNINHLTHHIMARKRIQIGMLVASTNNVRSIVAKRLLVEVRYTKHTYNVTSQSVIGFRQSF